jgi:hypothetical protein
MAPAISAMSAKYSSVVLGIVFTIAGYGVPGLSALFCRSNLLFQLGTGNASLVTP